MHNQTTSATTQLGDIEIQYQFFACGQEFNMAEVTPTSTAVKPYGTMPTIQEYSPAAARGWQNSLNAMSGAATVGSHMPAVEITMNDIQRDAILSADVLNEMTIQYWNAGPAQRENIPDGTHEKDGGTFTIKDGRVVSLSTPTGNRFTDIMHDAAGEVLSMRTSDGYTWEQHNIIGPDGMLKRHGYVLKLSNLSLHYDRLVVNSHGVTFLKSGKPGYVNTTTTGGGKGTMNVSAEGPMSGYIITLPNGKQFNHSHVPTQFSTKSLSMRAG
ncbi:MAG: hypothetical protein C0469_07965 [Cyanobacteria bacterium DS2.3.42]|nr:hypothetical protein [Cyanobacteria bacterium DS2.3.42]